MVSPGQNSMESIGKSGTEYEDREGWFIDEGDVTPSN